MVCMSLFICVLWWSGVRAQVPLDAGFLRVRGGPVGLWAVDGGHRWRTKGEAASPREASVSVGFGAGMTWNLAGSVGVEVAPHTWLSSGLEWGPRHRGMWRVEVHRPKWGWARWTVPVWQPRGDPLMMSCQAMREGWMGRGAVFGVGLVWEPGGWPRLQVQVRQEDWFGIFRHGGLFVGRRWERSGVQWTLGWMRRGLAWSGLAVGTMEAWSVEGQRLGFP